MSDLIKRSDDNLVVFAKNRAEMMESQQSLVNWADMKVMDAEENLSEVTANLVQAKENKWKTSSWSRQVTRAKKQLVFYQKIQAALLEGYTIVPDFPIDIFAVRTKRKYPLKNYRTSTQSWQDQWDRRQLRTEQPLGLAIGEGEYVDSEHDSRVQTLQLEDGTKKYKFYSKDFNEVDFPIKTVKPVILEETSKALLAKIFDELGCNPGRAGWSPGTSGGRSADPMVIGRVVYKNGEHRKTVSFLIAWWLDVKDIAF